MILALLLAQADWPMYNHDVLGSRHNAAEKAVGRENAARLEEKWRFPPPDQKIGVVHATPIVVDGYVYFGTATDAKFYKLRPDGTVRWTYRSKARGSFLGPRFQSVDGGYMASPLVTADSVYIGDIGGEFAALDRATGTPRWTIDARAKEFPGAHPLNVFFASPIPAGELLIVGGGGLEQVAAAAPIYTAITGRGFVMAVEPATGRIAWKYDVGPKPERYDPPMKILDSFGEHVFRAGPATSSIWSTPSYDAETASIYFGTDANISPRRPTPEDPRLDTRDSCAIISLDARTGAERWVTQLNKGDVWTLAMRGYDPKEGRYKDQSIGDTPKLITIPVDGKPTRVVGVGCKNGGFYLLRADTGSIVAQTPIYTGPPAYPLTPAPDPRMLALPSVIGGLQTGCATDGTTIYTNGIDALLLMSQERLTDTQPPTAGRVVALSLDTRTERWRHERPKVASLGAFKDVGDPVASGIAVANGVVYFTTVASGKLVALDASSGVVLKDFELGPVWSGPSVSRGRIYAGSGNTLFSNDDREAFFPKKSTGTLYSFGLPGEDEVSRMGTGKE